MSPSSKENIPFHGGSVSLLTCCLFHLTTNRPVTRASSLTWTLSLHPRNARYLPPVLQIISQTNHHLRTSFSGSRTMRVNQEVRRPWFSSALVITNTPPDAEGGADCWARPFLPHIDIQRDSISKSSLVITTHPVVAIQSSSSFPADRDRRLRRSSNRKYHS